VYITDINDLKLAEVAENMELKLLRQIVFTIWIWIFTLLVH